MIRKLKCKFITINMAFIAAVLLMSFGLLYLNSMINLEENSKDAMHDIAKMDQGRFDYLFEPEHEESKYSYLSTFIIDYDEIKDVYYIDGFDHTETLSEEQEEYVKNLIFAVKREGSVEGVIEKYNMRFFCTKTQFGTRIVLLDKRYEDETLKKQAFSFFTSGIIAFCAFFIISVILANIAVKPVERTMNQQKQFIADISHELKTPIAVISTNADIIISHEDSTVRDEKKWLDYIKDAAARMTDMINTMLYLAKSEEDEAVIELKEFELSSAAYEISLPFESICFEKGKELTINIDPDILIKGDEVSIKQLMVILIDNAVKYSNDNGKIKFSVFSSGDKAHISVFNTGEPIPKENIPHIFERFYRVDKARSREKGGSGLGLSIAKRIIEQNEGSISVTSNEQHGTVFECSFKQIKNKKKDKKDDFQINQ